MATPTPPGSCASLRGCTACLTNSTCGYCYATETCLYYDRFGNREMPSSCPSSSQWETSFCSNCASRTGGKNKGGKWNGLVQSVSDCNYCTEETGCGFCSTSLTCAAGTMQGAFDSSSTNFSCSQDWHWQPWSCPTPCASRSCDTCSAEAGCGWCASTASCHIGSSTGRLDGACDGDGAWKYRNKTDISGCPINSTTTSTPAPRPSKQSDTTLDKVIVVGIGMTVVLLLVLVILQIRQMTTKTSRPSAETTGEATPLCNTNQHPRGGDT